MPYLPIDPNEKVTATSGGATSQPVAQTGVTSGGVGGGSGPQGGAPKAGNSYTNLTSYLQANAGNTANADAVKSAVIDPLAQQLQNDNAVSGNATEHRANLDKAVNGLRTTGGVQSALEQAYGNTYGNQGNKALDAAISGQGVLSAAQRTSGAARPMGPAPKVSTPPTSAPATTYTTPNPASSAVVNGKTPGFADPTAPVSNTTSTSKAMTWTDPSVTAPSLPSSGRTGTAWQATAPGTPSSGGAGHNLPSYMSQGGVVPQGGHYENLMNKIRGKC